MSPVVLRGLHMPFADSCVIAAYVSQGADIHRAGLGIVIFFSQNQDSMITSALNIVSLQATKARAT